MFHETNEAKLYTAPIHENASLFYRNIKRITDIVCALLLLVLFLPLLLLCCIIIPLESPGSPLFFQERLGVGGRRFNILKLRSMVLNAEKDGPQWASQNDERITKMGQFIRKTRIDELPQLINILKGDMSFVGPRPEREFFYEKFERDIPEFRYRLCVKPGLTGWAQINGGYELNPKTKLQYDLYYIRNRTCWFEIQIVCRTIFILCNGHGAR
ncbi:sugar transferase [Bacillus rhizoplanae]|uniref:sugar transferase n=1 Tax=Bacillus rhizoplanae TaxID=2880966 RepID=UPI003D2437EE